MAAWRGSGWSDAALISDVSLPEPDALELRHAPSERTIYDISAVSYCTRPAGHIATRTTRRHPVIVSSGTPRSSSRIVGPAPPGACGWLDEYVVSV